MDGLNHNIKKNKKMSFLKNNLISVIALTLIVALIFSRGINVSATSIIPEKPLSAQWVPNAVKITFDSNGGGVAPGDQIYTYGIERSLPDKGLMVKAGYHFIGWAESPTATSPTWYGGNISSEAFGYADETKAIAKTLYAVWEADDTATASDIKKNLTAHINDKKISGTMNTYTDTTKYIDAGGSYYINSGYHSGGYVKGNSLSSQTSATASASSILSGYTAWVNGSKITGTYSPPTVTVNPINIKELEIVIRTYANGSGNSIFSIYFDGSSYTVSRYENSFDDRYSVTYSGNLATYQTQGSGGFTITAKKNLYYAGGFSWGNYYVSTPTYLSSGAKASKSYGSIGGHSFYITYTK